MFGMRRHGRRAAPVVNPFGDRRRRADGGKAIGDERKKRRHPAAERGQGGDAPLRRRRDVPGRARTRATAARACSATCATTSPRRPTSSSGRCWSRSRRPSGAVKASRAEREARLAEIAKELEQLELVRRPARALLPKPAVAGEGVVTHARPPPRGGCCCSRSTPTATTRRRRPPARPAAPARRAAAGGDRRQGQGGQVDAAQRAGRRGGGAHRRGRVHAGRHLVPRRRPRRGSRCTRSAAHRGRCRCAGTTAR